MRIARLCVTAACAVSAATAASASAALPEFTPPFGKPFTSTINPTVLETMAGTKVTCKGGTDVGEVSGPKTGSMTMTFTSCSWNKTPCNSPGSLPGVIETAALSMQIGYIAKATKKVGADLVPTLGGLFMTYGCGSALQARVAGSVIGLIGLPNVWVGPSKPLYLHFVQKAGVQKVTKLEGGLTDVLETSFGGPFEGTGLKSTDNIFFGENVALLA